MKSILCLLLLVPLMVFSTSAQAYSCSVSSSGVSTAYNPTLTTDTVVQSSATVVCNRTGAEPATISFSLSADNGQNYASGSTNSAKLGSQLLDYDVFKTSGCSPSSKWKTPPNGDFTVTNLNFNGLLTVSTTINYWVCIKGRQTGLAAGTYTDLIAMTLSYGASQLDTNTFPVNISSPWQCSISSAPGTVAFGPYLAYGPALNAATSFGVTCSNYLPYTLAVDPPIGSIYGLAYTLSVSTPSNAGTGALQTLSINGAMAGGQAGTCATGSCTGASNPHTLTVTY